MTAAVLPSVAVKSDFYACNVIDEYELSDTLRDIRNIGHWGCGDLQLIMRDRSEIEKAKELILKAYENN